MPEPWSLKEVEATVADYFRMFELHLVGQKYNKTEHRNHLLPLLNNRTPAAVELKHQNISAILNKLGWHFILGYKPARNYQRLLFRVVADRIRQMPQLDRIAIAAAESHAVLPSNPIYHSTLVDAPRLRSVKEPTALFKPDQDFVAYKRDYVGREARNHSLGKAGEEYVVQFERWRLISGGQTKFADKVERVSETKGDGLGFDVLSFESSGRERLIEVKTTAFAKETPFFLTHTELDRSRVDANQFFLYRVFEFRQEPKMFTLHGSIERHCILDPINYRARFS
ncbi:MAG: DUF3883 domain-containing protein [Terriglobia bacterium]